jgi:integrase
MRGSIVYQRKRDKGADRWSLILERGERVDPKTGKLKRQQQWIPFKGTKEEAENKLIELLNDRNKGTFIEPHKMTLGQWLVQWVEKFAKQPRTYDTYKGVITNHLVPNLGVYRLQELKPMHLETYYRNCRGTLAESTLEQHHMILSGALKAAERNELIPRNVARFVDDKPRPASGHDEIEQHCWTEDEQRRFLDAAKAAGDQPAAFYALALETGMRKSELGGLLWKDVDLSKGEIHLKQQIVLRARHPFTFGPLKGKKPHTVYITTETVALLRRHRTHQAEVKLASGGRYHDHGLVFAREWGGKHDTLGEPLLLNNIGQREFSRLIKASGVRRIKFHGMRHTNATLAIADGENVKVVQERLGHKKVTTTLDIYAHVLPEQNRAAAERIGARLHGTR